MKEEEEEEEEKKKKKKKKGQAGDFALLLGLWGRIWVKWEGYMSALKADWRPFAEFRSS